MPPSWKSSLATSPNPPKKANQGPLPRTCLVGVGNDLRGDDSAGLVAVRGILARGAASDNFLPLEGGPAPENLTGAIRKFAPEQVIFIDAAHLEEAPGMIRWINREEIDGMSASSHSLPLSILAEYLIRELNCEVRILGIQPEQNEIGEQLSEAVQKSVDEIVAAFGDNRP